MENFNILYIDDQPDQALSRFLNEYKNSEYNTNFNELIFNPEEGYESLIKNTKVKFANIIFLDSRLFEERTANFNNFTGEEFQIILKKYFPFIEVIVITQNEDNPELGIISKYKPSCGKTANDYYKDVLPQFIYKAIKNIKMYRNLAKKLEQNLSWEAIVKEKILNSLNGNETYDELTKKDIDKLIIAFKEIQEKIDG